MATPATSTSVSDGSDSDSSQLVSPSSSLPPTAQPFRCSADWSRSSDVRRCSEASIWDSQGTSYYVLLSCPPLFCSLRACDFGARCSHCSTGMQCLVCFAVHASMRKRTLLRQKLNRQNGFPLFLIFFNVNVDPSRNYFNTSYRGDGGCKFNLFFWQWGIIIF